MIAEYVYDASKLVSMETMRELSVSVNSEEGLKLYLKDGTAEIFGRELPPLKIQQFQKGDRFTIFTWTGCTLWLEYQNSQDFFLLNDESLYPVYAMINQYLHELRTQAQENKKIGPRVLVCGANQSGKTTVTKALINYGCKLGWTPVLVDLDPITNAILAGGCIGACVCKDFYPSNGIEIRKKIVLFHGYSRIQMGLLKNQLEVLGQSIQKKLALDLEQYKNKSNFQDQGSLSQNRSQLYGQLSQTSQKIQQIESQMELEPSIKQLFASGCVVNMPPLQSREQKEVIDLIVKHFGIDVILGLDDEVCNSLRQNLLLTNGYGVIRTSKPCGLKIKEESEQLEEARKTNQKLYQQYFKGLNNDIDCHVQEIGLNDLLIYRLKISEKISLSTASLQQKYYYEKIDFQKENATKSIIGVLNLPRAALDKLKEEEIYEKISKSTLGVLVHLSDMKIHDRQLRLFLPGLNMDQVIKDNVCVIGDITWFESSGDKKK